MPNYHHWPITLGIMLAGCSGGTVVTDDELMCHDLSDHIPAPPAADYWVTAHGDDNNDGLTRQTAFASIQAGVDALTAGQTLVIGPGEYFGPVLVTELGSNDADTVIRAELPGTVTIRGDIPSASFTPVPGYQWVYVADCSTDHEVQAVNELDTLMVLSRVPNIDELEFTAGRFYQDRAAGRLYLSSSDRLGADAHRYTLSTTDTHGLYLDTPRRVVVEGLAVTGFHKAVGVPYNQQTLWAVYGIFVKNGYDSVIRDCRAYLNGRGIGSSNEYDAEAGGNLITGCRAWGNGGVGLDYDTGGIDLLFPHHDQVVDSVSFRNMSNGISMRGSTDLSEANASTIRASLAWGNRQYDYWIKAGENHHLIEHSVTPGSVGNTNQLQHCVIGTGAVGDDASIILAQEESLDPELEFADPLNFDYRLQASSRFVDALDGGGDRGAFAYQANVFYLAPGGNDSAGGLSLDQARRTLGSGDSELAPGTTVYLAPGEHPGDITLTGVGTAAAPIIIRGRGVEPAVLTGSATISDSAYLRFERVHFAGEVRVIASEAVAFDNCVFLGGDTALTAINAIAPMVTQSTFTGFATTAIDLSCAVSAQVTGNLFDNDGAAAVLLTDAAAVQYADHNSYTSLLTAWETGGDADLAAELAARHDWAASEATPLFEPRGASVALINPVAFVGAGSHGRQAGHYRHDIPTQELRLLDGPRLHSVSATTANIEWVTSHPAVTSLSWGPTPEVPSHTTLDVNFFGSFSLTGLSPNTTYYLRIDELSVPTDVPIVAASVTVEAPVLSFTTAATDAAPVTYYVATSGADTGDGSSDAPWRSIQHAADQVNVGDTVLVAGGVYHEKVRLRATGATHAPITFAGRPGQRVVLDGYEAALNQAFVIASKHHLIFDGFFFQNHDPNQSSSGAWEPHMGGQFNIFESSDIHISRVLSDGRGTGDRLFVAKNVTGLVIDNAVDNNKLEGSYFERCPDLVMERSVIARPMIFAFILRNLADQASTFRDNVFTDMYDFKAAQNINLFQIDGSLDGVLMENNTYYVREFTPAERYLVGTSTAADRPDIFIDPLFADPIFQGVVDLIAAGVDVGDFSPDRLMYQDVPFDFRTFMATNPTVTAACMGLDPTRFDAGGLPN